MNICVVSAMRNEGPFLLEWIAHMRAIGVTDFVIYSNDCDDGTDQMLASLDQQGILHHIPQTVDGGASPQWQALRSAWKQDAVKSADWVMVCDVDEFMNVHIGQGGLI
ncbi:MAG: glycosyltransferase family 2 protein, partial [Planktomarina sp.]